jgi:hypothetical protein
LGEFDRTQRPKRLPTILTRDEVKRVLVHLEGTYGLMARLLYSTGLRVRGCVRCGSRMSSSREKRHGLWRPGGQGPHNHPARVDPRTTGATFRTAARTVRPGS